MIIENRYLVAPATNIVDGATLRPHRVTVHKSHESAINRCHRALDESSDLQQYVIYQAVSMVRKETQPINVCDIDDNGEVSCV